MTCFAFARLWSSYISNMPAEVCNPTNANHLESHEICITLENAVQAGLYHLDDL